MQSFDTLIKFEYDLKSRLFYQYALQQWDQLKDQRDEILAFYRRGKQPDLGSFNNEKLFKLLERLYSPVIQADIVTGDDAELGAQVDQKIKQLHAQQLSEILTIESIMHKSHQEADPKKKVLNFEQNNVLAGLLKKLVGQLPLDRDLTPKNYCPIDPNKSVFASKYG